MTEPSTIAARAARAGAEVLRRHAGNITDLRTKSGAADMVSAADIASGVEIVRVIAAAMPGVGFVVEEPEVCELAGVTPGTLEDSEVWVIDPLDGTTSFVHGYPCWSVSIALLRDGRPAAGVVYNVPADEVVSASAGAGATANGRALACAGARTLEGALLSTGFPYDRGEPFSRQLRLLDSLVRPAHDVRRDGSAAIDLCNVAHNRTDGFWETALKPWDMAAGVLIVTESGGLATDFDGRPWTPATTDVVAANPRLHAVLLEAIRAADLR